MLRPPESIRLIANPSASRVDERAIRAATRALSRLGDVDGVVRTTGPGEATLLARQAVDDGCSLAVALGGDGTAGEVAEGLTGSGTALLCLPGGCTSVYARIHGLAGAPGAAAERVAGAPGALRRVRVDLGTVDERHFLFMAGIGLTASLMRAGARHPRLKARLRGGYAAYAAAAGLVDVARRGLPCVRVRAGTRRLDATTLVIQNSDVLSYLGPRAVAAAPGGGLATGTLALAGAGDARVGDALALLGRLLGGDPERVAAHERVSAWSGLDTVVVESADGRPFPLEIDGTWIGDRLRARFGVAPLALEVATLRRDLPVAAPRPERPLARPRLSAA